MKVVVLFLLIPFFSTGQTLGKMTKDDSIRQWCADLVGGLIWATDGDRSPEASTVSTSHNTWGWNISKDSTVGKMYVMDKKPIALATISIDKNVISFILPRRTAKAVRAFFPDADINFNNDCLTFSIRNKY